MYQIGKKNCYVHIANVLPFVIYLLKNVFSVIDECQFFPIKLVDKCQNCRG